MNCFGFGTKWKCLKSQPSQSFVVGLVDLMFCSFKDSKFVWIRLIDFFCYFLDFYCSLYVGIGKNFHCCIIIYKKMNHINFESKAFLVLKLETGKKFSFYFHWGVWALMLSFFWIWIWGNKFLVILNSHVI